VLKFAGFDVEDYKDPVSLRNKLTKIGLTPPRSSFTGYLSMHILLDHLMNEFIAPKLIQPTFIYQYPYPLGGPAKEVEEGSWYKQRAELFIGGMEIANISTPQTDPLKLRHWYEETLRQKIEGNLIGQVIDEDYLTSIEYGLPPCATGAMGFDRLMMLMTNKKDIKDTIFFPYLQTGEKHNRSLFRDGGSGN
jgi:lysyl-tRNA synthetase class 2